MSSGELIIDDNQVKPGLENRATEYQQQYTVGASWADEFAHDEVSTLLTAMWEIRARQKGWREKVAKSNAQTQGRWVASHCLRDSKLCCSGDRGYDGTSSDIWSCGVILFVLMAGYLPFDELSLIGLYKKIWEAFFSCPSWFSSGAMNLIKRILDPNPLTV
ncbi:hypothetical protein ERO13_A11G265400v2 [Gossypium hirsutum]|nr:sucrose non-fermenting protein kinase 1 isoform X3 [Gossypium hirsutum]XP_016667203.1 sucrose non-fermenting protein kinase 1 isoform X3 [Gossypium hirsutum]XP_016667209.1 sucrose non-fermenting protein kinase 1 isoform X3 [Gossypium hirsutum]XP_016667215.1 sucrose non-fermenting protein kinase 1 isoform X3 [Gossypium hirsutum]XP_016667220.1 sucrose non-fermenting protein kinase 1 isoform X3 [Gossypium hirsutum]XP_040935792.1 sucrose non-fermenting protein kinase 1 isoform X3 [Gossypium hir